MPHHHLALARFKPGIPDAAIRQWFEDVGRLRGVIPGILDYSWGRNDSPEGLSQGYTHGFVITFQDAAARDAYLPHPAHEKVKQAVLPLLDAAVVLDFKA